MLVFSCSIGRLQFVIRTASCQKVLILVPYRVFSFRQRQVSSEHQLRVALSLPHRPRRWLVISKRSLSQSCDFVLQVTACVGPVV